MAFSVRSSELLVTLRAGQHLADSLNVEYIEYAVSIATAATEAKEAAQLQLTLLGQLQSEGMTTAQASHLLSVALGQPLDGEGRTRMATRFRKRAQRSRRAATGRKNGVGVAG